MTPHRFLSDQAKRLEHGPLRGLLALAVSVRQTVRYRSPQWLHVDRDGDWINRQRGVCVASPTLFAAPFRAVAEQVQDLWCFGFDLRAGDTVVDVGAGIGDDVVAFSRRVGQDGHVIAIEASPRTYRCLEKTIRWSRLSNVTPLRVAVSDEEGELTVEDGDDHIANRVGKEGAGPRVRARRLDVILGELGVRAPALVKLNIEGAETAALRGMPTVLRTARRVVVSCHDFIADQGGDPAMRTHADVEAALRATGRTLTARPDDPRPWVRYYIYADAAEGGA